jgi:hypothetical protein
MRLKVSMLARTFGALPMSRWFTRRASSRRMVPDSQSRMGKKRATPDISRAGRFERRPGAPVEGDGTSMSVGRRWDRYDSPNSLSCCRELALRQCSQRVAATLPQIGEGSVFIGQSTNEELPGWDNGDR